MTKFQSIRRVRHRKSQAGFTIVELMIATAVFSVILLICTNGIIQIGRVYYKGINAAQTQETARNLMDEISRSIQFTGAIVTPTTGSTPLDRFCIGSSKVYTFLRGHQLSDNPTADQRKNVLVVDDGPLCLAGPQNLIGGPATASSRELLAPNMRLSKLEVIDATPTNPTDNLYTINVRVVYGDDDLLCSPALNNCNSGGTMTTAQFENATDLTCKSIRSGAQFCAVSALSTVVQKRI